MPARTQSKTQMMRRDFLRPRAKDLGHLALTLVSVAVVKYRTVSYVSPPSHSVNHAALQQTLHCTGHYVTIYVINNDHWHSACSMRILLNYMQRIPILSILSPALHGR